MKLIGVGHIDAQRISENLQKKQLSVILLPGIGDIIYTWYKLIHYVNDGYVFNVKVLDCQPQRSHQIMGCLEGMKSFEYIGGFDYSRYWLVNIEDLLIPPLYGTFRKIPVLHINSFLETNQHIDTFMPNCPVNYNIKINTTIEAIEWSKKLINSENYNILLYTSNYKNNIECKTHPDPQYWVDLSLLCYEFSGSEKPLNIYVVGAQYDADLTIDTYNKLEKMGINTKILLNEDFYNIIELIRNVDHVISYESGLSMISDCLHTPLFHIIRCQGGERDDKKFPFLGPINPSGFNIRYWPIFYDESIEEIRRKIL